MTFAAICCDGSSRQGGIRDAANCAMGGFTWNAEGSECTEPTPGDESSTKESSTKESSTKKGSSKGSSSALPQILPDCIKDGSCNLNDITGMLGNAARFLFAIVGSIALLFFMWGGWKWMTAMGDPGKAEGGRKIMLGTVTGIVIMFAAQALINFAVSAIAPRSIGSSCGNNKIYADQGGQTVCLTQCEIDHEAWSCRMVRTVTGRTEDERRTQASAAGCEIGLCPGAANIVCCPGGGRTSGGESESGGTDAQQYVNMYRDWCGSHSTTADCGTNYCSSEFTSMSDGDLVEYANSHTAGLFMCARSYCRAHSDPLCDQFGI